MVSAWWVVAAFVLGGYAGAVLVALMAVVSSPAEGRSRYVAPVRAMRGEFAWRRRREREAHGHA